MRAFAKSLTLFSTLLLLIACGGGGSLDRGDNTPGEGGGESEPAINISLEMVNANGESDKALSIGNPLTILATVTDESGAPIDASVVFASNPANMAVFAGNGIATTNSSGLAAMVMTVGAGAGGGEISATVTSGDLTKTATITFTSSGNGQGSLEPATLELYSSAVQMASSGSDKVELIALVKNAQSVLMEGVDVSFSTSSDAGVELQVTQGESAADGTARAMLSTQNNAANRTITVTAQTGTLTQSVDILITGTEVFINGSRSITLGDTVDLTLRVQDSDGVAIANQAIEVTADKGTLSSSSVVSGADGQATVQYTGGESGVAVISASALNASGELEINVQEDAFSFTTYPEDDVELGEEVTLTVTWNREGSPFVGGDVTFTASRGTIVSGATGTTDASGQASFTLRSDNAGGSSITATGTDSEGEEVSARVQVEFVATVPATVQVDASPDQIGPDGQTSTITAIVKDASGNLVKGAVVSFNVDDTSTGSVSPSQATTDSNGVASTVFTSGSVTSEDAVLIRAEIGNNSAVFDTVTLTVGKRAFDVSIGTGNVLQVVDDSTYLKEFAVFVTDSAGQPVENVELTASSTPIKLSKGGVYRKGTWGWDGDVWFPMVSATCDNEDQNENGILESSEDFNNDNFLTPGIVGSLSFKNGSITDANGQATLQLRYPKAYAIWYDSEVSVFAESFGSEASASMKFNYSIASSDIDDEAAPPPDSPFGTGTLCSDTE
ncbi:invasin [Alteromonas aestuariivivens]|uniref:Invasin n=1 Tax=Alteromonas aestuariivivens TaxID=1938339 RepID=A0A3D8MAZ0_9ALTE|nr:Ig-like domain-containing protein [Alteromonas aestuariivivens]RDV27442.1 invasin [Alteromonas aestuariivivens]